MGTVTLPMAEALVVDSATVMDVLISPSITETTSVTTPSDSNTVYSSISTPAITAVKELGYRDIMQPSMLFQPVPCHIEV